MLKQKNKQKEGSILQDLLFFVTGLVAVLGLAFLLSNDKKRVRIKFKPVAIMIAIQVVLTWILMKTTFGMTITSKIAWVFEQLLTYAKEGISFVLGGLEITNGASVFFIDVLLVIVFMSVVIGLLNHLRVLPFIIKWLGKGLNKITGAGSVESFNAIASAFFGQSDVFLIIKDHLEKLNEKRLYTICASAMGSVSASIMGSYMAMLDARFVVVAIPLNVFSALIIASIVNPYTEEDFEQEVEEAVATTEKRSVFQVISDAILDGGRMALIIGAMLIGFIALLAMINAVFAGILGISLTEILGYILAPVAFIIGVPWADALEVGSLMATKLISNEFVAIVTMNPEVLSPKAYAMISTFLMSFANFSSIGIIAGSVKALNARQGDAVAKFGLKLVAGATLASLLSACIVGLFA